MINITDLATGILARDQMNRRPGFSKKPGSSWQGF
jgi:hypothetical protein